MYDHWESGATCITDGTPATAAGSISGMGLFEGFRKKKEAPHIDAAPERVAAITERYGNDPAAAGSQNASERAATTRPEAGNDNSEREKARQELLARRQQLEAQIEIGGASTPHDREMLADLDNRLRMLDQAA